MLHPDGIAVYIKSLNRDKAFIEYVIPGAENLPGAEAMECFIDVSDSEPYSIVVDFTKRMSRAILDGTKVPNMNIHRWVDEEGVGQGHFLDSRALGTHQKVEFRDRNHTTGGYSFANLQKADAVFSPEFGKIVVEIQPSVRAPKTTQNSTSQTVILAAQSPIRFVIRYRSTEFLQKLGVVHSKGLIGNEKAPISRPHPRTIISSVKPQVHDKDTSRENKKRRRLSASDVANPGSNAVEKAIPSGSMSQNQLNKRRKLEASEIVGERRKSMESAIPTQSMSKGQSNKRTPARDATKTTRQSMERPVPTQSTSKGQSNKRISAGDILKKTRQSMEKANPTKMMMSKGESKERIPAGDVVKINGQTSEKTISATSVSEKQSNERIPASDDVTKTNKQSTDKAAIPSTSMSEEQSIKRISAEDVFAATKIPVTQEDERQRREFLRPPSVGYTSSKLRRYEMVARGKSGITPQQAVLRGKKHSVGQKKRLEKN